MRLYKISNRLLYQDKIQKLLQDLKIPRQKFQNLQRLDLITRSTGRILYSYQLKLIIKYLNLNNYSFNKEFYNLQNLYKELNRKYQYYINYQQDCTSIQVEIYRKLIKQLDILGIYYYQYTYNYVCVETQNENTQFKIFKEQQLRQYIIKNKYQTNKQEEFLKKLQKNQIQQFIFSKKLLLK